ncbi:MAG: DNA polymerase III subunit delta [Clostridiales bacterium]|nr:DNA polymerase III subunit delta [Clostridiales bacterium]
MKFGELKGHINSVLAGEAKFAPAYVVSGDDNYLRAQSVALFESIVGVDFADLNLSRFCADNGIDAAIDVLNTYPVFDEYRVVTLTVGQKLADEDKERLKAYISSPSESSILVLDCDAEAAVSFRGKGYERVDCTKLEDAELYREVKNLCAPTHNIDNDAALELAKRTQGYMHRIASEITKLKAYCERTITLADVCEMVAVDIDYQIYALADAVSKKDAATAFQVLDSFYKNGIRAMRIINQMYDKYRKMLHAELNKGLSNDDIGNLLGMKGGAVYHLRKVSGGYSQMRLKRSVDYLHSLQYDVLSGRRTENSALQQAVLELLTF